MTPENQNLLEVIRQLKPDHLSDLECALNVIRNHAAEIKRLHVALKEIAALDSGRAQEIARQATNLDVHGA